MSNGSRLRILVQGDPVLRWPYVVVEAKPAKLPNANADGARALADYLVSGKGRAFLVDSATKQPGRFPLFYPADTSATASSEVASK